MKPLRICLVSSAYRPYISGVGEHVHHLGKELQKRGHEVHVLTTSYPAATQTETLPATRLGRGLVLPFARGQFTFSFDVDLPGRVKRFFSANSFDLIHCHGIFPPELAYWAAALAKTPVVVTFHTLIPALPKWACATFRSLFPGLQKKVTARIAVSNACRQWAEQFFPGEFRVIYNGVDLERFHPDARQVAPSLDNRSLLFVGRLEKRKGLEVLLRALPEVLKPFPDTRLVVVGFGPLLNHYQRLCRHLGIEKAVQFIGPVPNDQLPGYYTGATVYVAPTLGRESMGIVLIEAMACARPVIASDIPGYNEVITHEHDGLLVQAGEAEALAQTIVRVLSSPELQTKLGQQGLHRARQFAWPNIARQIEEVYKAALS